MSVFDQIIGLLAASLLVNAAQLGLSMWRLRRSKSDLDRVSASLAYLERRTSDRWVK